MIRTVIAVIRYIHTCSPPPRRCEDLGRDSGSQKVQHFRESKPALRPLHATTFGVRAQNSSDLAMGRRPEHESDEF